MLSASPSGHAALEPHELRGELGVIELQYCYNAQAATSEDGILLAAEVTTSPRDVGQLVPMVEAVKANTGRRPGIAVADNGYLSESNLEQLARQRQRCLIAAGREGKKPTSWPTGRRTQRMHRILRLPDGPKLATEAKRYCSDAGIKGRTLDRAKKALGVQARPRVNGDGRTRWWSLPSHGKSANHAQ